MTVLQTNLKGVYELIPKKFEDHRGILVKTFNKDLFVKHGLERNFQESFYSISKKNVLRGMHFQLPPHQHAKLVYVTAGEIWDIALDIRKDSLSFGKYYSTLLSKTNAKVLYMSRGFAHGFLTLSESATVVYSTTTMYVPASNVGIRWNSFGFDWGIEKPIVSERDGKLPTLKEFTES